MPDYIFENKSNVVSISNESEEVSIVDKAVFDNGIFLYYKGAEFPQKGMTTPDILSSVNIVKAIFVELLKIRLNAVSILSAFNRVGMRVISQYFIKNQFRSSQMLSFNDSLYHFACKLTSNELIASQFSKIVSHIVEYDNAYRLRFIDLASEIDEQAIKSNNKKELQRLFSIWCSRETQHKNMITSKVTLAFNTLLWILKIPSIKKAFIYAIQKTNFEALKYDNIDKYWACLRIDYDFMGLSSEARRSLLVEQGYSIPLLVKRSELK